jgi:hypothetical protein
MQQAGLGVRAFGGGYAGVMWGDTTNQLEPKNRYRHQHVEVVEKILVGRSMRSSVLWCPRAKCGRLANWSWCHIAILEVKGSAVRYWACFEVSQAV